MNIDTHEVESIADPLQRALAADKLLSLAERIVEHIREVRGAAMRTYARTVGGEQAARDLKLNRTSMYRTVRTGVSPAIVEHDDVYWQQQAIALNGRLRARDFTREGINVWWLNTLRNELNYRTPMQAWSAGDREAVIALVP